MAIKTTKTKTHHRAKLTVTNVKAVKRAFAKANEKGKDTTGLAGQFATKYGVTKRTIFDVRDGKTWKHVTI